MEKEKIKRGYDVHSIGEFWMFIGEFIVVISGDRCWIFVDLRILLLEFSMFFSLNTLPM